MELSCKIEYTLLALLTLARDYERGEPVQIRTIASQQNIPERYLEQLFATLRRGGLVTSLRGAKGGYLLAKEPWNIKLSDVIACLEGDSTQRENKWSRTIESKIIREIWQEVEQTIAQVFQNYTLDDLRDRAKAETQLDIMYYI